MQRLKQKMGMHREEQGEGEGIVDFLMRNVYLQNKIDFYMGLDATQLEHLTTAPFRNTPLPHDHRIFAIALLKRNPFVLNLALANDRYNPELLFAFLTKHPHYDQLNALEDILLPFAKKYPHKLLLVLALKPMLKHTLLGHLHTRQVFKLLYTSVFCCTQGQLADVEALAEELMQRLVGSVFDFGPLAEKRHGEVDWGQVAANMRDFLADLTLNLSSVEPQLVVRLLKVVDCALLSKILSTLASLRRNQETEDYCQALIQILFNLLKLLESFKLSEHAPSLKGASIHSTIEQQLLRCARLIAQQLPLMLGWLVESGRTTTVNSSSGERVLTVGLVRYRLLEVVEKVLSVSDICDLGVDYQQFDLMPVIELFLEKYKWNNIVHILLVKIAHFALAHDYIRFRKRHLEADNLSQGVLAGLLAAFRNRKYVFLHSLSMANQGNRHAIYLITRILTAQVHERGDLNELLEKFRIWRQFMHTDMKEFEKTHQEHSNCFDSLQSGHMGPLLSESATLETPVPGQGQGQGKSLEMIEQMLGHLREEERWSPKQIKPKGKEDNEAVRKLDSMAGNFN